MNIARGSWNNIHSCFLWEAQTLGMGEAEDGERRSSLITHGCYLMSGSHSRLWEWGGGPECVPQDVVFSAPAWALVMIQNEALLLRCLLLAFQAYKHQLHLEYVIKTNDLCLLLLCLAHEETDQARGNGRDRWSSSLFHFWFTYMPD